MVEENTKQPEQQMDNTSMGSTIKLLQERLKHYEIAENKAKQENEPGRARRFNRAIKTIKQLFKDAQAGKAIDQSDIPPELPPHAVAEVTQDTQETNKTEPTGITLLVINSYSAN